MPRASTALVASLALALPWTPAVAGPRAAGAERERSSSLPSLRASSLVDAVVAVVRSPASTEPEVVTRSQLEEETRIALVSRGEVVAGTGALDAAALQAGLEWLLDQMLAGDEAARLRVFEIERADSAAELARFEAQFPTPDAYAAFLSRWDLAEEDLEAVLRRTLRVRRYVESRVWHAEQVPEPEITAWLDQHATELGTRDRDAARAHLARARIEAETRAFFRDLRARAEIRLLASPAQLAAAGGP